MIVKRAGSSCAETTFISQQVGGSWASKGAVCTNIVAVANSKRLLDIHLTMVPACLSIIGAAAIRAARDQVPMGGLADRAALAPFDDDPPRAAGGHVRRRLDRATPLSKPPGPVVVRIEACLSSRRSAARPDDSGAPDRPIRPRVERSGRDNVGTGDADRLRPAARCALSATRPTTRAGDAEFLPFLARAWRLCTFVASRHSAARVLTALGAPEGAILQRPGIGISGV